MMGYMKISEAAQKWDISERRVNTLCLQGRIENAIKFGNTWAIPNDTEKPNDLRVKTGKYVKKEGGGKKENG
ncbi:MAG: DNA-binding protein [Ruthenibacterium sp.]